MSSPERDTQIEKPSKEDVERLFEWLMSDSLDWEAIELADDNSSSSFQGRVTDEMVRAGAKAAYEATQGVWADALPDLRREYAHEARAALTAALAVAVKKEKETPPPVAAGVVPKADLEAAEAERDDENAALMRARADLADALDILEDGYIGKAGKALLRRHGRLS